MPKWNFVAMGQAGLTGWTGKVARPVARELARRTGQPEAQILSLIGAVFLAKTLIGFLREVDAVIAAGEPANSQRMTLPPGPRTADAGGRRRVRMRNYWEEEVAASGKGVSGLPGAPGKRLRELERDWA